MKARGAANFRQSKNFSRSRCHQAGRAKGIIPRTWTQNATGIRAGVREGMWRIVQLGEGDDFVLATGENAHCARVRRGGLRAR